MKVSILPNIGGHCFSWRQVGEALEKAGASVCYHQAVGLLDDLKPRTKIEESAEDFLSEARKLWGCPPDIVAGFCFGSLAAHRVASRLESSGGQPLLVLIDPIPLPFEEKNFGSSGHSEIDVVTRANRIAASRYQPSPVKTNALVFLSGSRRIENCWTQILSQAEIVYLDCDHLEILGQYPNLIAASILRKQIVSKMRKRTKALSILRDIDRAITAFGESAREILAQLEGRM